MLRYALLVTGIAIIYSCIFKSTRKSMDISDFLENKDDIERFINENFTRFKDEELLSPLRIYQVNLINKTESLTFCTMDVQQCWIRKIDTLYAFFILIKTSADVEKHISERYGRWQMVSEIGTQDGRIGGNLFSWNADKMEINMTSFFNPLAVAKYEQCELVICSNLTFSYLINGSNSEK